MTDVRMKLVAELTNKVSDPLKNMQRDVESFTKSGKDFQGAFRKFGAEVRATERIQGETGRKTVPAFRGEFEALRGILRRALPQFGGGAAEIGTFGRLAGAAGFAAGVAAGVGIVFYQLVKHSSKFANEMRNLRFASRESGLSPAQLEQLELGAEEFGLSAEDMAKAATSFSESMLALHRHDPAMLLAIAPAKEWTGELEQLAAEGRIGGENWLALFRAMDNIKKAMPGIEGQVVAGKLAALFNLPTELARLSGPEFQQVMRDMKEFGPDPALLSRALQGAVAFNAELVKTEAYFDRLKTTVETYLLPPTAFVMRGVNSMLNGATRPSPAIPKLWPGQRPPAIALPTTTPSRPPSGWSHMPRQKFAEGGIVTGPTIALIGEEGPEAVIPLRRLAAMERITEAAPGHIGIGSSIRSRRSRVNPIVQQIALQIDQGHPQTLRLLRSVVGDSPARLIQIAQHYPVLAAGRIPRQTLPELPTKTLERLSRHDIIDADKRVYRQAPALERRSAWGEALAAADDDRGKIDIRDRRAPFTVEGTGSLGIKVSGPPGMEVNASGAGMFKTIDLERRVRVAG